MTPVKTFVLVIITKKTCNRICYRLLTQSPLSVTSENCCSSVVDSDSLISTSFSGLVFIAFAV